MYTMKLLTRKYLLVLLLTLPQLVFAQEVIQLKDPSGKINIAVSLTDDITYSVYYETDLIIEPSPISMKLMDQNILGKDPKLIRKKLLSNDQIIYPQIYFKESIRDHYNELRLDFKGNYSLIFRAYEDGFAYRFVTNFIKPFIVEDEEVIFNFPKNPEVFAATPKGRTVDGVENQYHSSFQNTYKHTRISNWDKDRLAFLPILVESAKGIKVCITEADLLDYPGMFLKANEEGTGFYGHFAAYPKDVSVEVRGLKGVVKTREPYIAKVEGKTQFPWRVAIISENDADLLVNDMVFKLAKPADNIDFSWIKPGKVAWDWWNDWNIYNVDFRAGINTETYKYYIDFASKEGIEYVILDEGWAVAGPADLFQVVPEIDLEELIRYSEAKNVGLILWAGYRAFDLDMDRVCQHYSKMGIKGFKIDFMDRDDQYMIDFNRRCAEMGAKYKLLINLHGTSKPTGLQRTFPNAINFEGVHGLEELKWAAPETDQVTYDVVMPFIRMVAGPIDYTQGAMTNMNKENFKPIYSEPMSQGTRCRQLAEFVVFYSPLSMLCDAPTNYLKEPKCTRFIAQVPTVWDESKALIADIGKCIVMARQKDGEWYVGGLTNWEDREVEVDLSFLGSGEYKAEIFKDGINADRVGKDYKYIERTVRGSDKLTINMVGGGGFAVRIYK